MEGSGPEEAGRRDSGREKTAAAMPERPTCGVAVGFARTDSGTASVAEGTAAEVESTPWGTPVLPVLPVLRAVDERAWAVEDEEVLGTSIRWVDPN